jgi:hypothetical protein
MPEVDVGMPYGISQHPNPRPRATSLTSLPLVKPKQALVFVFFPMTTLERALRAKPVSSTWRAPSGYLLPEPTDLLVPCNLAIERASLSLIRWCSRASLCPLPLGRACRALPPARESHVGP